MRMMKFGSRVRVSEFAYSADSTTVAARATYSIGSGSV